MAPSSISLHLSALAYVHKLQGMPDPTDSFIVKKMISGVHKLRAKPDTRLPITPDILRRMLDKLQFIGASKYTLRLLTAMFLLAFFAFLRVGEITVRSQKDTTYVIQLGDVVITESGIVLSMSNFKHNTTKRVVRLAISPQTGPLCPVSAMYKYMSLRGTSSGPLFCFPDRRPVSRSFFVTHLHKAIHTIGMDTTAFKSHSFRMGAATYAASKGVCEDKIKLMGRWRSSAFKKYIRIQTLSL